MKGQLEEDGERPLRLEDDEDSLLRRLRLSFFNLFFFEGLERDLEDLDKTLLALFVTFSSCDVVMPSASLETP
jgi:hypothetical protein